ncbi:MAG: hypothetical protein K6E27_04480 [Eubacterium sp.]|nr:hypothetical protein [Eubacterium sp.]
MLLKTSYKAARKSLKQHKRLKSNKNVAKGAWISGGEPPFVAGYEFSEIGCFKMKYTKAGGVRNATGFLVFGGLQWRGNKL